MEFLSSFHEVSMKFPWSFIEFHGVSVEFHGISVEFP